jgi:hypothetical protein
VLKNWLWIFGLTNNLEQVLVGKEIEPWELSSLGFQELIQILLNLFEFPIEIEQKRQEVFDDESSQAILLFVDSFHFSFEHLIVAFENRIFVRKLL